MDAKTQLFVALIAFAATIFGGIIVGVSSVILKKIEYLNDYNKIVLQKRIRAYEKLEELVVALKTAVMDKDGKLYHFLFASEDDWLSAYKLGHEITGEALWLSEKAFNAVQKLDYLMFRHDRTKISPIEFGKKNYQQIALLREEMERVMMSDMLTLHKVRPFLRGKGKSKLDKRFLALKYSDNDGLQIVGEAE